MYESFNQGQIRLPPNFNFLGKPLFGEKYVEGKKEEGIMPSLVVTMSALASTTFCMNLLIRVKLGYPPNFNFLGKGISRSPKGVLTYP